MLHRVSNLLHSSATCREHAQGPHRDRVMPPQLLGEAGAELPHTLVHQHHVLHYGRPQLRGQLFILQESTGHALQGLHSTRYVSA